MIFLNSVTSIETKYFTLLMWHIDDNLFCWKSVAFIIDATHVVFFGWPLEVFSFLKLEWRKWRHKNVENEQMDGEKKEHTSIKQHVTVSYGIWQLRNLNSEYLHSYTCFQEEQIVKQEQHDIICRAILPVRLLD